MKKLKILFLILIIVSCKNANDTNSKEKAWQSAESENKTTENLKTFKLLSNSDIDISSLDVQGTVVDKRIWDDKNGQNISIFAENGTELYVRHYLIESNEAKLHSEINDSEKGCDADLTLEFDKESISVTDLDNDNSGEITFAYRKACISDVSPKQMNLIMLEEKNQYSLKGQTAVNLGNETLMEAKIDTTDFSGAPNQFLNHAKQIWDKISGK